MRKKVIAVALIALMVALTLSSCTRGVLANTAAASNMGYVTSLDRYPNDLPWNPYYMQCQHTDLPWSTMDSMTGIQVMAYYQFESEPPDTPVFNNASWQWISYTGVGDGYQIIYHFGPLVCGYYVDGGTSWPSGYGDYYLNCSDAQLGIDPFTGVKDPYQNPVETYYVYSHGEGLLDPVRSSVEGFTSQCFSIDGDPYAYYFVQCWTQDPAYYNPNEPDARGLYWNYLTANLENPYVEP